MAVTALYLLFVKRIGPDLMKNRRAFNVNVLVRIYDMIMVIINGLIFSIGLWSTDFGRTTWSCDTLRGGDNSLKTQIGIYCVYGYFMSKFLDYFDTIFFVLKKKYTHITTLHVYHHAIMPLFGYMFAKFY